LIAAEKTSPSAGNGGVMFNRNSANYSLFYILIDVVISACSLGFVTEVRPNIDYFSFIQPISTKIDLPVAVYLIFAIIWVSVFSVFSVYDERKKLTMKQEIQNLSSASVIGAAAQAGVLYLSYRDVSRVLFLIYVSLSFLLFLFYRVIIRQVIQKGNLDAFKNRVIIAGAGPVGKDIYHQILCMPGNNTSYMKFLDDDESKRTESPDLIVGKLDEIREICLHEKITDFIIALPPRAYNRINDLVAKLIDVPVQIWLIPDYFHLAMSRIEIDDISGIPMVNLRASALSDSQRFVKRIFDIVVTLLAMIPAIPIMVVVAINILLDDGQPIFFKQIRVGENGKTFTIYKFRTMVKNAESMAESVMKLDENGNIIHKSKDDPRVTKVGRILRHYSLDELPQLFNVLLGNMSWVGPRPELPFLVQKYEPWQRKRFTVPPGITGWWQINGRSNRPLHLNTADDIYYIDHYSYWLDCKILFKTVLMVLKGKGAY
jgi:exopolysaccharide biosynthesis polyprenyl glycosylphosphotransferase